MSHLPNPRDVADLFLRLAAGEAEAFGEIAAHLRDRLRPSARRRLRQEPALAPAYDEEDAIQSGFARMWLGILKGTMAPPDGVDSFLRMASTIIDRRIGARARAARAAKRNPNPDGERDWTFGALHPFVPDDLDVLEGRLPGPDEVLSARDELEWLLSLVDPVVRDIALGRLQGLTVAEIAFKRQVSTKTIDRLLEEIVGDWARALRRRDA